MQDLRQSSEFARYMEKIGWRVGKEKNYQFYLRHLPILGNFIKIQRPPSPIPPSEIDNVAKKYRAFGIQIDYSPTKTLQIDLTQSQEEIFKQMKKDGRYGIRKAEENKIVVRQSDDIEAFIKMWHKNALRRGFWIPFKKEIGSIYEVFDQNQKANLLLAYHTPYAISRACRFAINHMPLAGTLILIHDKTASYFHAASTPQGRQLSAPYLVVWETIKLAKNKKCKIFDFEGIYDERFPLKSWQGFTHFKKSFEGKEVEYPGAFIKFYNSLLNMFFSIIYHP